MNSTASEFTSNIRIKAVLLTRDDELRVKKMLCHTACDREGNREAMSVRSETKAESGIGETIRVIIHALIIALVIRTFLFQPFNIPSGSMKNTLLVGDYLFVSKYSYGYSHYSIPLSPPLFPQTQNFVWLQLGVALA